MPGIADKLSVIADKRQKLLEEEARLLLKRKEEIGDLVERLGLLSVSDEFIIGLFLEAQEALSRNADKVAAWEEQGSTFLTKKRHPSKVEKAT